MTDIRTMSQHAPYPQELAILVSQLRYKTAEGWRIWLDGDLQRDKPGRHTGESRGMTLVVQRCGPDTYNPESTLAVNHYFPVPPATYDRRSWQRWLFDQVSLVELHEQMENFILEWDEPASSRLNGPDTARHAERPYAPSHGPGQNPYLITELSTETERRTSFTGELNPE